MKIIYNTENDFEMKIYRLFYSPRIVSISEEIKLKRILSVQIEQLNFIFKNKNKNKNKI